MGNFSWRFLALMTTCLMGLGVPSASQAAEADDLPTYVPTPEQIRQLQKTLPPRPPKLNQNTEGMERIVLGVPQYLKNPETVEDSAKPTRRLSTDAAKAMPKLGVEIDYDLFLNQKKKMSIAEGQYSLAVFNQFLHSDTFYNDRIGPGLRFLPQLSVSDPLSKASNLISGLLDQKATEKNRPPMRIVSAQTTCGAPFKEVVFEFASSKHTETSELKVCVWVEGLQKIAGPDRLKAIQAFCTGWQLAVMTNIVPPKLWGITRWKEGGKSHDLINGSDECDPKLGHQILFGAGPSSTEGPATPSSHAP